MEDDGITHHPLCELTNAIFTFLLSQRFLFPLFDQGRILDLFPPIWFLPDRARKSTHPHFDDLIPAWSPGQVTEARRQKETSPFLDVPCPRLEYETSPDGQMDGCSDRPGEGRR